MDHTVIRGRSHWWGPAVLALAVVCSACGGSGSSSPTTTTTVPSTTATPPGSGPPTTGRAVAVSPSPGCTPGASPGPGSTTLTPTIQGTVRTAIVHVPTGDATTTPVALVVNMHGSRSTAVQQEILSGMDATADADTFIVVYPQADIQAGNGFEWNVPGQPLFGGAAVPAGSADDVSFVEHLVTSLEQRYCIDQRRVFATGFSGGARMASQLGCDASATFAAVAPVSGLRLPAPCPSTRAVPVVAFHGTSDPVDPYIGNGQQYWTYSVPVAAGRWAAHDDCSRSPANAQPATGVALTTYARCSDGSEVQLYSIVGEGHEWPGGPTLPRSITRALGPQSSAISANDVMWAFFEAHPLPS